MRARISDITAAERHAHVIRDLLISLKKDLAPILEQVSAARAVVYETDSTIRDVIERACAALEENGPLDPAAESVRAEAACLDGIEEHLQHSIEELAACIAGTGNQRIAEIRRDFERRREERNASNLARLSFRAYLDLIDARDRRWEHEGRDYRVGDWRVQPDGSIVGGVYHRGAGDDRRIGTYRIEADGTVTRWPFSNDILRARAKRMASERWEYARERGLAS